MATVGGFKIIPVCFNRTIKAPHFLYVKKHTHQKNNSSTPADKTLFIVNLPPYCDENGLRNIFSQFGSLESIFIQSSPGQVEEKKDQKWVDPKSISEGHFKVAYLVFKSAKSLEKCLNCERFENFFISDEKNPVKTGVEKWCAEYRKTYPNPDKFKKEVDKYIAEFDVKEAKAKEEAERLQKEADDDGWTLVTHGGRKPGVPAERIVTRKERRKKQDKELINFYNFQQRESRRENIAELRKKFEKDKQRIELMRQSRKFKPF